ncbi:hypothetical protein U1Q18_019865 [Sarracenia purpurea var. burkii]
MEKMMMMMIRSPDPRNESISDELITTSTCPTWKLYENPFYYSQQRNRHHQLQQDQEQDQCHHQEQHRHKQLHCLHLPISAGKIAASFWDLTFIRPIMDSELDIARAQIMELKAELEYERRARKKTESVNKKLTRELSDERNGREVLERVCGELVKEVSAAKAELSRTKNEMEEERKMLRMAEVIREERVQMKLAEANLVLEEKILEYEVTKRMLTKPPPPAEAKDNAQQPIIFATPPDPPLHHHHTSDSSSCNVDNAGNIANSASSIQRKASTEAENPHIMRGIKGFVEFPKVVRAIGCKSRDLGSKLECQRAQLRILLNQKNPIRSNNLIMMS